MLPSFRAKLGISVFRPSLPTTRVYHNSTQRHQVKRQRLIPSPRHQVKRQRRGIYQPGPKSGSPASLLAGVMKAQVCSPRKKKRTLTNLYNQRPAWLENAHRTLDQAVFAAYGWPPTLTTQQLLANLLALNHQSAAAQNAPATLSSPHARQKSGNPLKPNH